MHKTLLREFIRYVTSNCLGMLGLSCYILADTFFIAQWLGENGLAALNFAIPVYNLISGTGLMLGMGGGARYTLRAACGEAEAGNAVFSRCVRMGAAFGLLFVLCGAVGSRQIAMLLGADGAALPMTEIYLRVLLLCAPLHIFNQILLCFIRNDGAPRLAMAAMLTGSFSNILLDWVMVFVLGLGMFGAVAATCMAPVISMLVLSPFLLRRRQHFHLRRASVSFREGTRILSVGGASFIAELSNAVVIILFNLLLQRHAGNTGVAAYGIIANLALVVIAVFTGVAQGMQPLVSRYAGVGEMRAARRLLRFAAVTVLLLFAAEYGGIFLFADGIAALFDSEGNTALCRLAASGMRIYFLGAGCAGLNLITAMYLACTEQPFRSNLLSLLRGLLVIVPAALVLSALWQVTGVWLAFPVTEGLCLTAAGAFLWQQRTPRKRSAS